MVRNTHNLPASLLTEVVDSNFEKVDLPRLRRRVDVYESSDLNEKASHAVITGPTGDYDIRGKSFLARLDISRLGVRSDVQRALSLTSKQRALYIGPIPDM